MKRQILKGWQAKKFIYNGLPPMKSDQRRTSGGIPSFLGSLTFIHLAKSSAVCRDISMDFWARGRKKEKEHDGAYLGFHEQGHAKVDGISAHHVVDILDGLRAGLR